jgi:protein-L-isoaspartate(D-aspartate) O-methyltransferase
MAEDFHKGYQRPLERMIEKQLMARDFTDAKVIEAIKAVPRHIFVDEALWPRAYGDTPLPIGYGQTISQPYIVALMTEALALQPTDRVLEIGSGCGYQSAVLSHLSAEVYAVERLTALVEKSRATLKKLNLTNIFVKIGDGLKGWPEMAPFDAILVAAFSERVPKVLLEQLAPGGKMIIPLGPADSQVLVLITKDKNGEIERQTLVACRFVPLIEGETSQPF